MNNPKDLIKKRIMIVGANGLLGQRLVEFYMIRDEYELLAAGIEEKSIIEGIEYRKLDIGDKKEVSSVIKEFYPDYIINAAAFTNVDGCEREKVLSWQVNVTGVENLAKYAVVSDARLIHISSDYIFDGTEGPYSEDDIPNPISYYGREKLAAENSLKAGRTKYAILRTNVLFGPANSINPDFVKWVVTSLREGKKINIVTDQINNPTFVGDLVQGVDRVIEKEATGVFNISGADHLSRYEFAQKIADFFELDKSLIATITTEELKQLAPRPLKSGLITTKAENELGFRPHTIEEALKIFRKDSGL